MTTLLLIHIVAALVGLLSGFMAMAFRKGSGWHSAAGNVFFVSMLAMSSSAVYLATFHKPNRINLVVGLLTFYLVLTAWVTVKRRVAKITAFDWTALLIVSASILAAWTGGFEAAGTARGSKDGVPAFGYFIFGTIGLLCATADVRMIRRGGVAGVQRIGRHLRRMGLALLIATMSLYPGQAKLFSMAIRKTNLLYVPHVLLIGALLLWMVRIRRSAKSEARRAVAAAAATAFATHP